MSAIMLWATLIVLAGCTGFRRLSTPSPNGTILKGSEFYKLVATSRWKERDSLAMRQILNGNLPSFLKRFTPITVSGITASGKKVKLRYFVLPDYLSLGSDDDWARVPLTTMAAQQIADSFHCFLPTRKMVNDIYKQVQVKLEPVPMFAFRDSAPTFFQHHLIIEGQRKQQKGLIAALKKMWF